MHHQNDINPIKFSIGLHFKLISLLWITISLCTIYTIYNTKFCLFWLILSIINGYIQYSYNTYRKLYYKVYWLSEYSLIIKNNTYKWDIILYINVGIIFYMVYNNLMGKMIILALNNILLANIKNNIIMLQDLM